MTGRQVALIPAAVLPVPAADLKTGPPLNYHVVENWAQLPEGWNFGECSGVDVDKDDKCPGIQPGRTSGNGVES
jgi:hypothetical protein